jgi:putative transposase
VLQEGALATAAYPAVPDPNVVDPPSQHSSCLALRPPREFTQYVSICYTERLLEAGIEPSVGSVGDSYDNALAETINGLFKAEVIHRRGPWRNAEAVEFATLEWVDWFNHRRLLEPIGNIPPAEAEASYYDQVRDIPLAA